MICTIIWQNNSFPNKNIILLIARNKELFVGKINMKQLNGPNVSCTLVYEWDTPIVVLHFKQVVAVTPL